MKIMAIIGAARLGGFRAFGDVWRSARQTDNRQVMVAAVIAANGFVTGAFTIFKRSRGEG